jgi:hypothetical protein
LKTLWGNVKYRRPIISITWIFIFENKKKREKNVITVSNNIAHKNPYTLPNTHTIPH